MKKFAPLLLLLASLCGCEHDPGMVIIPQSKHGEYIGKIIYGDGTEKVAFFIFSREENVDTYGLVIAHSQYEFSTYHMNDAHIMRDTLNIPGFLRDQAGQITARADTLIPSQFVVGNRTLSSIPHPNNIEASFSKIAR